MSVSLRNESYEDAKVTTGGVLVLRLGVFDPAGISRIFVQCFPFSIANSNKAKAASGELLVSSEDELSSNVFDVEIQIPEDAILGKWGVQRVEFTNGRGQQMFFYRGQDKIDHIQFDVIARPIRDDEQFSFSCIEVATASQPRPVSRFRNG
jgi:hypothetical protein